MFNILKGITKAAVGVVTLPVDIAADIVTMGGAVNDKRNPYTVEKVKKIMGHLDDATD